MLDRMSENIKISKRLRNMSVQITGISKKDSADKRLLIWRATLDMIGHGSFHAKYMLYQAAYFQANPSRVSNNRNST